MCSIERLNMRMKWSSQIFIFFVVLFSINNSVCYAYGDSLKIDKQNYSFKVKQLIAPIVLIGAGTLLYNTKAGKSLNKNIAESVVKQNYRQTGIDNILAVAPAIAVYGLNFAGVEGRHNFKERTVILATSGIILCGAVYGLKYSAGVTRPDGSNRYSFPSGHTAVAFMGAEFLRQEYKDVSVWYGVAGYAVATATGAMRIYNNKHWLTDVVAGAGIGILSTKIGYWLYPSIEKGLFPKSRLKSAFAAPYYDGVAIGISFNTKF